MENVLLVILAYLIGSIPFSYFFSRLIGGVDIRSKGSGNVGATNVLRNLGVGAAILALSGDVIKGLVAAWLGVYFGGPILGALCAMAAIIGHCWPVFLNFKGGKGVATSAGIVAFLMPAAVAILLVVFILIVAISKYVSLGSVSVAFLLPIVALLIGADIAYILLSILIAVLVIYKHRENIKRLRAGVEPKVKEKARK